MEDIISKYNIDKSEITKDGGVTVDERNRNRLKEIFKEFGFPNSKLIGKDAMQGIFFIIQHSDGDKEWQKSQLSNIEKAVENGDMDGQKYAYLYDRIKINSGEKQLYGTQFAKVDPINKTVELADTENIENLDNRRMKVGMMPIKMYKEYMLKNLWARVYEAQQRIKTIGQLVLNPMLRQFFEVAKFLNLAYWEKR